MCGLAGFVNFKDNERLAKQACIIQQHRGPDSQDIWQDSNVALSHQRLSIIDLDERANQPLVKDNLAIIFNGEIYNYQELKEGLLRDYPSLVFKTTSDTEVLLELFRVKKEKCLDDLVGMFAFAIYDKNDGKLFIAVDHFGIKPIFYTQIENSFAFSSELKTLTAIPGIDKSIDTLALVAAMNYLWIPQTACIFAHCKKLPAAHYIYIDTHNPGLGIKPVQYWQVSTTASYTTEAEAKQALDHVMEASIRRHMVADVPVSAFLSGGLDSSLISVMSSKLSPHLSTFTIGTSAEDKKIEQMPEDEKYARKLADQFGFDHHEIVITPDIVKELPFIVKALDEPLGDPAAINTYLICKAAREKGVKILLSGMGADEIFFGYRRQQATMISLRYRKIPGVFRKMIRGVSSLLPVKIAGKGFKFSRWVKRFLSFADLPVEEAYMRSYSYYNEKEMQGLFRENIGPHYQQLRKQHLAVFEKGYNGDPVNQMCYTDIHFFMQGLNLTYTDRSSMAASVEVRVPFIDREVVTTAMNIPGAIKFNNKQPKYLLKKVAEKSLPQEIIYRPKASFGAPIRSWISKELAPMIDTILNEESVTKRGIFNYSYIKKMIDDDRKGVEDNAYRLYMLLTTELWFREYID
jgi:asparagine synthase (glutamine-hydrolysing)